MDTSMTRSTHISMNTIRDPNSISTRMPPTQRLTTLESKFREIQRRYKRQDLIYKSSPMHFRSIVVTGCNPWTVYDYTNYGGQGVCFYPADTHACSPGFFRNAQVMGGMQNRISSVRKGCFSNIKLVGEPLENLRGNLNPSVGHDGKVFTP